MFNRHLYAILYYFWDYPINLEPSASICFFAYFRVLQKRNTKQSPNGIKFAMIFLGPKGNQKTWR